MIEKCGISAEKVRVIYNGLSEIPIAVPLAKRPLNVLTVANFSPRKGHLEYLLAIKNVHRLYQMFGILVGGMTCTERFRDNFSGGNGWFCKL